MIEALASRKAYVWSMHKFRYSCTQRNLFEILLILLLLNLIKNLNQILPLGTQADVFLVLNQSEFGKYNLISGWFNKISKRFLCVDCCACFLVRSSFVVGWSGVTHWWEIHHHNVNFLVRKYVPTRNRGFGVSKILYEKGFGVCS